MIDEQKQENKLNKAKSILRNHRFSAFAELPKKRLNEKN